MHATTSNHETSIFERLLVQPASAKAILALKFCEEDEQRMQELVDKNNRGTIDDEEKAEMEAYRRIGSFLGILQAKARIELQRSTDGQ